MKWPGKRNKGKHEKTIGGTWEAWLDMQREGIKEDACRMVEGVPFERIIGWREFKNENMRKN